MKTPTKYGNKGVNMKEMFIFIKDMWWAILLVLLAFAWGIFYAYTDIKAKWNIAHLKNCPCLVEVQK